MSNRLDLKELYDAVFDERFFKIRVANEKGYTQLVRLDYHAAGEIIEDLSLDKSNEVFGEIDSDNYIVINIKQLGASDDCPS